MLLNTKLRQNHEGYRVLLSISLMKKHYLLGWFAAVPSVKLLTEATVRNGNREHINAAGFCFEGLGYISAQCSSVFWDECILRLQLDHKLDSKSAA